MSLSDFYQAQNSQYSFARKKERYFVSKLNKNQSQKKGKRYKQSALRSKQKRIRSELNDCKIKAKIRGRIPKGPSKLILRSGGGMPRTDLTKLFFHLSVRNLRFSAPLIRKSALSCMFRKMREVTASRLKKNRVRKVIIIL